MGRNKKKRKCCIEPTGKMHIVFVDSEGNWHTVKDGDKITLQESEIKPIKLS